MYIDSGNKENNKALYDNIFSDKQNIEKEFGKELFWERLEHKIACWISYSLNNVDVRNKDDWNDMMNFYMKTYPNFKTYLLVK